jgi:hypothetical protein
MTDTAPPDIAAGKQWVVNRVSRTKTIPTTHYSLLIANC